MLPVRPLSKRPHGLVPNGLTQATSDLATVFRWWEKAPDASIGIVAAPSGLLVIDVDGYAGGGDSLVTLERELGPLPETVSVATGGGDGHHYYFKHPGVPLGGKLGEAWTCETTPMSSHHHPSTRAADATSPTITLMTLRWPSYRRSG